MARQIVTEIVGDSTKFRKATDEAVAHSSRLGGAFHNLGGIVRTVALSMTVAVVAAAAAFVAFGIHSINNAVEQERAWNRVRAVFGKASADIISWSEKNSHALGVTDDALELSVSKYAEWARHAGISSKSATTAAEAMAKRASEISLSTGQSYDEVFGALLKGAQGATKGLKDYGVVVNTSALEQYAYAHGIAHTGDKLTETQKALARQGIILQQTASFTKTAKDMDGSYADSQRKLAVIIDEVQDNVGAAFLKVATAVMPTVLAAFDTLSQAVNTAMPTIQMVVTNAAKAIGDVFSFIVANVIPKLAAAFAFLSAEVFPRVTAVVTFMLTEVWPKLISAIEWVATNALPVLGAAFQWIGDTVIPAVVEAVNGIAVNIMPKLAVAFDWISKEVVPVLGKAFQWIVKNVIPPLGSAIDYISKNVLPPLTKAFGWIVENIIPKVGDGLHWLVTDVFPPFSRGVGVVVDVIGTITTAIGNVIGFISTAGNKINAAASGMWDGIWNAFRSVINSIIRGWNGLKFSLPNIDLGPLGHVGGFTIGTPNLPYLHGGGIVPGTPGSDVLTVLQAGERVIPRGQAGGPTIQINIENFTGSDSDIDRLADRLAVRLRLAGA